MIGGAFSKTDMTVAERFEDFHRMVQLRNRISNALMAIALFEVESKSNNLARYVEDGLAVSNDCVSSLEELSKGTATPQYEQFCSKILHDILTKGEGRTPDRTKLDEYEKRFRTALAVFEQLRRTQKPEQSMTREAEGIIREIDKEMNSLYAKEESLYRGSFLAR
jgi:hypothetical protein